MSTAGEVLWWLKTREKISWHFLFRQDAEQRSFPHAYLDLLERDPSPRVLDKHPPDKVQALLAHVMVLGDLHQHNHICKPLQPASNKPLLLDMCISCDTSPILFFIVISRCFVIMVPIFCFQIIKQIPTLVKKRQPALSGWKMFVIRKRIAA